MTETLSRRRLMQGNEAIVEGAIAAGVRFFAGYPISPATEIIEMMSRRMPEVGGRCIQMEDEMASMAAIIGAAVAGAKAMTASSGPGISLKQENIGFAIMVEIPCVVVNVMRGGPSTGLPTLPSQMDVMQARWGVHGDHPTIALAPWSVRECFDLTVRAVNLSERFRTPVYLLSDATLAHLREMVVLPEKLELVERPRPSGEKKGYVPYRPGPNLVPPMADFGQGYRWHPDSNIHDEYGFPAATRPEVADSLVRRLCDKVNLHADEIVQVEERYLDDAEVAVFAYGSVARSAAQAVEEARAEGKRVGLLRVATVWPFPDKVVARVAEQVKCIIVAEMNLGQLVHEVKRASEGRCRVVSVNRIDGLMLEPRQVAARLKEVL